MYNKSENSNRMHQSNIKLNNNESFKLLNFSDDDKSSDLPDLDLPEISLQRKRKVKRYVCAYLVAVIRYDRKVYSSS